MGRAEQQAPKRRHRGVAGRKPSFANHRKNCIVCAHPSRAEIEADFVNWKSPAVIATEYDLPDRKNVYRHAHATDLFARRQRNVRAALEKIIERAGEVEVSASAVVAAVQAYAKINAAGQWVDRSEHLNLNELFERMSAQELEAYAQDGTLPAWFTSSVRMEALPATPSEAKGGPSGGGDQRVSVNHNPVEDTPEPKECVTRPPEGS